MKLERSGGLDCLLGGEGQYVFLLCSHLAGSMEVIVAWIMWTSNIYAEDIWSLIQGARRAHP